MKLDESEKAVAVVMKSLTDVKQDMSTLYDEVRSGAIDLKLAEQPRLMEPK